jgi:hypothetical protein
MNSINYCFFGDFMTFLLYLFCHSTQLHRDVHPGISHSNDHHRLVVVAPLVLVGMGLNILPIFIDLFINY